MPDPAGVPLADAILAVARELRGRDGRVDLVLLNDGRVQAALEAGPCPPGPRHVLICRLAIAVARACIEAWVVARPSALEPLVALEHAEAWSHHPCAAHAETADASARLAGEVARRAWPDEPRTPAWAARIAAWAASSPKYGWPAVAALASADHVLEALRVRDLVAFEIARLCTERN